MAKINLIQAKGNSFYCDSIFSIGVYITEKMAVLIDSGISRDIAGNNHRVPNVLLFWSTVARMDYPAYPSYPDYPVPSDMNCGYDGFV
jgi:hypothetical protein